MGESSFEFKAIESMDKLQKLYLDGSDTGISICIAKGGRQTLSDVVGNDKTWEIYMHDRLFGFAHGEYNAKEGALELLTLEGLAVKENIVDKIKIKSCKRSCCACPSQWECITEDGNVTFLSPPPSSVGYYYFSSEPKLRKDRSIPSFSFLIGRPKKPSWLQRLMMRWCFGLYWADNLKIKR